MRRIVYAEETDQQGLLSYLNGSSCWCDRGEHKTERG